MKFNIGDKVTVRDCDIVYEITHITRDGCYVIENDAVEPEIYICCWLELYKPPIFSYFHPIYGLHDWEVYDALIKSEKKLVSIVDKSKVWYAPISLVEHYLNSTTKSS